MSKSLEEYSREELIAKVRELKSQKKFGLVWEDKPEKVVKECETKLPVVKEVEEKAIENAPGEPTNIIIEGDNYHALSVLNYTHAGKIDVIYIDPPYNTGNKDFVYNDCYVDKEDSFRHSKWLSFMDKRLRLAKNLLADDGVIFISIDDNEQAELKMLCNDLFGEDNFIACFIVDKTAQGANQSVSFKTQHEFCLMYVKNLREQVDYEIEDKINLAKYKYEDDRGKYALTNGFDSINSPLTANKNRGYTIYYNEKTGEAEVNDEYDKDSGRFLDYDNVLIGKGYIPIRPGIRKGIQYPWNWTKERFLSQYKDDLVFMRNKKGQMVIWHKNRATGRVKDTTIKKFDTRFYGNQLLVNVIGEKRFDYPKSLDMMEWVIKKHKKKDATILDFFAGSGTTGQAVMELNREDGGHRQFILVTNNEAKIAGNVTYPRIKTVITGIRPDRTKYSDGIPANLRYFKTDFVEKGKTTDDTREALITECCDMIRIRENAFEYIASTPEYRFYKNEKFFVPIIFDQFAIAETWEKVEELNKDKLPVHCYNFSYNRHANEEEIPEDTELEWTACSIPETILEVYRKIFRKKEA